MPNLIKTTLVILDMELCQGKYKAKGLKVPAASDNFFYTSLLAL
jgi:hypothetical protein